MIVIDSAFLRAIGIQDGDLEAKNKYAFYKGMTMTDGTVIHNERSFYAHATVNGQVPGNQYAFYKAIGDFYNEPIYDQYSFYMNATFDGVNPIVNQYNFFKTAASLINASAASFTVSTDLPITNVTTVQFTDTSTGDVDSWLWDFGDGTTSTLQNPTHIYTSDSIWTVSLTVTSATGSETVTKTLESGSLPVVDFSSDLQYTEVDKDILFTSAVTGVVDVYLWDFGDGNTSTDQNPTHKYDTDDTFTVELTATNKWGTATETKTSYIETYVPIAPVADFSVDNDNPIQDEEITFTNQSIGIPEPTYLWDFGDGQTSTAKNPSHIYDTAGIYDVSLTVTNTTGTSTETKTGFITVEVSAVPPVAAFTVDNSNPTLNTTVQFTDQSTGEPTSWLWDFGDGTTSTLQNPTKKWTNTNYKNITLTVTNAEGSDNLTKNNYVRVYNNPLIKGATADTNGRLGVGTNGQSQQYIDVRFSYVRNGQTINYGPYNGSFTEYVTVERFVHTSITFTGIFPATSNNFNVVVA